MRMSRPDLSDEYLITKGVLFLFLGFAYAITRAPQTTHSSLHTVTSHVPLQVFGWMWLAAGAYCVIAGLCDWKVSGFAVGVFMPIVWGLVYLVCWLANDPGRGWVLTAVFWSISRAMYCASGLVDPARVVKK